jgi:hypothetical protein
MTIEPPAWPRPEVPDIKGSGLAVTSGPLSLCHAPDRWDAFVASVGDVPVATGWTRPLIGYIEKGKPVWWDWTTAARVQVRSEGQSLTVEAGATDPGGGRWTFRRRFRAGQGGAIDIESELAVDRDRATVFLPVLVTLPGHGSFGERKSQGLLAGVEYLDDEPSSSTADVPESAADRRVPFSYKITFPLMAIAARGAYVGLIWDQAEEVAALFDSPDRIFGSGAHVMGIIAPGANQPRRMDGALMPQEPFTLAAGSPLRQRATLIGGAGSTIIPAVQQYVAMRGLPARPQTSALGDYVRLAASGWIDTPIRVDGWYRHACVGAGGFPSGPAADASWMQSWLAGLTPDRELAGRLEQAASEAAARVPADRIYGAGVSHLHDPLGALVLGHVPESLDQARRVAAASRARFEPDGALRYRAPATGMDFGRTQPGREASGYAAQVVSTWLVAAVYSGDRSLIEPALEAVRTLQRRFAGGVPRGAQTWEIPLHTPDILGSAHLVHAFTLAYALTGDADLLNAARYWAWTGVPFVYLRNPTGQPVGPFATIPVLGATNWAAPVWMGLPVQWCGLVYADALAKLAEHDPSGPWRALADGITASGLQQTYPADDPHHGLLPDSFNLNLQTRNPADINPGTLQPLALALLGAGRAYDLHVFRTAGLIVHASGAITDPAEGSNPLAFTVSGWSHAPASMLIHGLPADAVVRLDGKTVEPRPTEADLARTGTRVIPVTGRMRVEIDLKPH